MIKIVDTGLYEISRPRIRFYDTDIKCFVKNTADNRRNALFSMLLSYSRYDIEEYEIEKYAKFYVDLLKYNQKKEFIGFADVYEFMGNLVQIFDLKFGDNKLSQIFKELATVVVCDQRKSEFAYKSQCFEGVAKSVSESDLFEM